MSRAERFALAGAVLLLLLQAAVAVAPAVGSVLEYRYVSLATQPWRALTGHVVHINWLHVLVNAAAWFIVARLFAHELSPARQAVVLLTSTVVISAGLAILYPQIAWYRGFSGVLHGLFFAGATTWLLRMLVQVRTLDARTAWLPAALVIGGWVKVALEQPAAGATAYAEWLGAATVPQAHLLGAACGTAFALLFALARGSVAATTARNQRE
jgi:rhomboid family GlyGly-CTERM serine protease